MEVLVIAPLSSLALDMALDTVSGGGMAVLACGSGRKLKAAAKRVVAPPQGRALRHPKLFLSHHSPCVGKVLPCSSGISSACRLPKRYSSSLVPPRGSAPHPMRPHVTDHASVPNPRSAAACQAGEASWVCDPDLYLSSAEQASLQTSLDHLNAETGVQCALVVLADLHGRQGQLKSFRSFGTALFNAWGIGSAKYDNGVLVVLFHEARRLEIITGTGMSASLPDEWLAEMQQQVMVPQLKAGNHTAGLQAGIRSIEQRLLSSTHIEWRDAAPEEHPIAISGGKAASDMVPFLGGAAATESSNYLLPLLLFGGLVGLGSLSLKSPSELEKLEEQLRQRKNESWMFQDSMGAHTAWPYQTSPGKMDLLDVTGQLPQCASHPFLLASRGLLSVRASAHGFGRRSLEVKFRNTSSDDVDLHLPAGSLCIAQPRGDRVQPLVSQEDLFETVAAGEERTVLLDTYCGDSGASIPTGDMVLSPFVLKDLNIGSQATVWRWSAKFQPQGRVSRLPAADDFRTLEESFGITRENAEVLFRELQADNISSHNQRESDIASLRSLIRIEERRLADERERRRASSSPGGGSRGGSSFGGGCSSGGGAGCSF